VEESAVAIGDGDRSTWRTRPVGVFGDRRLYRYLAFSHLPVGVGRLSQEQCAP